MPDNYRRNFGSGGEDLACQFLQDKGFEIIERNYHAGRIGELDLVARKENLILFAEVKTRRSDAYGGGIYSISQSKKKNLKKSAEHFLTKNNSLNKKEITFRFDLILVKNNSVEWIEDILR